MTPDARARIPAVPTCRGCVHCVIYTRADGLTYVERFECAHPQRPPAHPICGFRSHARPGPLSFDGVTP